MSRESCAESPLGNSPHHQLEKHTKSGGGVPSAMPSDQLQRLVRELQLENEELRSARSELAEARDRYRDLFETFRARVENISDCIWELDAQGRFTYLSPRFQELTGYSPAEFLGKTPAGLIAGNGELAFCDWLRSITPDAKDSPLLQVRCRRRDGQEYDVEVRGIRQFSVTGEYVGVRGTVQDITRRKRAEAALIASDTRFHAFFDQTADGLFVHDFYGDFLDVNPAACASLGFSRDELLRLNLVDVEVGFDLEAFQAVWRQITPGNPQTVRGQHRRKDGTSFPVEVRVGSFDLDGVRYFIGLARDITHREQREMELDRMRNQLAEAQRIAHLGSWEYVAATQETVWSEEQKRIFGLDPHEPSPVYDDLLRNYVHPDDAAEWDRRFRGANQDNSAYENEYRIVRPDGSVRFVYSNAQPYLDGTGQLVRYVGATLDITDRKTAQLELQRSNERLELAKRATGQGIWDWNITTGVIDWSPEIFTLLGLDPQTDSPSMAAWEAVLHPEDRVSARKSVERSIRNGTVYDTEFRVVHPDGKVRWIGSMGQATYDDSGRAIRMTGVCVDITERRTMLEKIRQWNAELERTVATRTAELTAEQARTTQALKQVATSESRFRTIFEQAPLGVALIDLLTGKIHEVNPRFAEIAKRSREEMATIDWMSITQPDDLQADLDNMARLYAGDISGIQMNRRLLRPDDSAVWISMTVAPVELGRGESPRHLCMIEDITDRKYAEESLKKFNETLEQQVQQRTEAIRMLRDVAVMANESQDPLQAAEYCLKQLATQLGWLCGHAWWLTAEDERFLSPRCVWYPADTDRWDDFRTVTLQTRLRRDEGLPGRAIAGGRPLWATQLQRVLAPPRAAVARQLGLVTAVAAPVFARGKAVAVLEFFSDRQMPRDFRVMDVLTGATLQLGRIVERREFEEHLLASTECVRREIAQNLHDDVGQELTGASLMTAALAELNPPATQSAAKLSADISACLSRTHEKLRRLCHSAMPRELQEGNLVDALKQLAVFTRDNSHIESDFECDHSEWVFDDRSSTQLYRLAQEAISNAIRHARASRIRIAMRQERGDILLTIEDDGRGMPRDLPVNQGMGLQTMRYRTGMLGGTLEIGRAQNGGTRVVCRVPASLRSFSKPTRTRRSNQCRRKS